MAHKYFNEEVTVTVPLVRWNYLMKLEDAIDNKFEHTIESTSSGTIIYTNDNAVKNATSLLLKLQGQIDLFKKSFDQRIKKFKLLGYTIIKTSDLDNLPII